MICSFTFWPSILYKDVYRVPCNPFSYKMENQSIVVKPKRSIAKFVKRFDCSEKSSVKEVHVPLQEPSMESPARPAVEVEPGSSTTTITRESELGSQQVFQLLGVSKKLETSEGPGQVLPHLPAPPKRAGITILRREGFKLISEEPKFGILPLISQVPSQSLSQSPVKSIISVPPPLKAAHYSFPPPLFDVSIMTPSVALGYPNPYPPLGFDSSIPPPPLGFDCSKPPPPLGFDSSKQLPMILPQCMIPPPVSCSTPLKDLPTSPESSLSNTASVDVVPSSSSSASQEDKEVPTDGPSENIPSPISSDDSPPSSQSPDWSEFISSPSQVLEVTAIKSDDVVVEDPSASRQSPASMCEPSEGKSTRSCAYFLDLVEGNSIPLPVSPALRELAPARPCRPPSVRETNRTLRKLPLLKRGNGPKQKAKPRLLAATKEDGVTDSQPVPKPSLSTRSSRQIQSLAQSRSRPEESVAIRKITTKNGSRLSLNPASIPNPPLLNRQIGVGSKPKQPLVTPNISMASKPVTNIKTSARSSKEAAAASSPRPVASVVVNQAESKKFDRQPWNH